ncbi:ABC transporter substrate-binding protein [Blastococcus sp. Marseille-P5729]|uniref:ABC transporter substrate-binding protein n=1 Tax=Blastococcus sp. Marseille-P5729 TaxID=2086582 RepID=UPI000D0FE66A|nr:ABC transporter substrate-binding protein [Blastococcus sp. Marseille-P5729]
MFKKSVAAVSASAAVLIAISGCSVKAEDSGGGGGDSGSLKTDVGVTDAEISLGILGDHSGPFKASGLATTHGNQMWVEQVNEQGGICDRKITLDINDAGYKPDNAVALYQTMKGKDLAIIQLIGSPILAALKQQITTDKMLTIPSAWASANLDSEAILMIGQTYDVEMINGLAWLQQEGKIAKGDKIGHIYVDSEYGQNAILGSQYYAEEHDLEIVKTAVQATDTDMTATVTKLKDEGVKAILLSVAPAATGSIAIQNASQGLNVPLVGNNPTFSVTLLKDEAVTQALANFHLVNSMAAYDSQDIPLSTEMAAKYKEQFPDLPPEKSIPTGYVYGMAMEQILKQACEDGDMTRQGLLDAKSKVDSVDTQGLTGKLDFSKPGAPTTREAYILEVDAAEPVGLKNVGGLFSSEEAKAYKAPHEK